MLKPLKKYIFIFIIFFNQPITHRLRIHKVFSLSIFEPFYYGTSKNYFGKHKYPDPIKKREKITHILLINTKLMNERLKENKKLFKKTSYNLILNPKYIEFYQ